MPHDSTNPHASDSPLPELDGHTMVPVTLTILGAKVNGAARVPSGPTSAKEMLPAFRVVADAVVVLTERSLTQHGQSLSCTKGCGACCRQLVPVAQSEAVRLSEVVEAFPEPQRSTILARFEHAEQRAKDAGLYERLADPESFSSDELKDVPMAYFRLGIACPFLEEESCSIYDERPLACREYLVTSPPRWCANPDERVAVVRMPLKSSEALARLDGVEGARFVKRVPLTLSLSFAAHAGRTSSPAEHAEADRHAAPPPPPQSVAQGSPPGTPSPAPPPAERTGPVLLAEFLDHLDRTRADA